MIRIDTTTGRRALKPRREPYWARLATGCYVGFRKLDAGEGTWIARWRKPEGGQRYLAMGHHPDFDAAAKAAREWFAQCEQATPDVVRVEEACRSYVEYLRVKKGALSATDAEGRFRRHVYGKPIGRRILMQLRTADIEKWHQGLITAEEDDPEVLRRAKDTANRDLASLKAALNRAFRTGLVASDGAWRRVRAFEKVARRRERFLSMSERKRLLAAASPELKPLIRAIALTAARPGEITKARVEDFDARTATLTLEGKTERRTVPLSPDAVGFFKEYAGGKTPSAPLVARADGSLWDRFAWRGEMQAAVKKAGLPGDVVLYSIRHAAISELIVGGLDTLSVARLAGTSVQMIQENYGHLVQDHVRSQLAKVKVL